jgi:hypothetical protein
MEVTLSRVAMFRQEADTDEEGLEQKLPTMVEEVQGARMSLNSVGASLGNQRKANAFLSSRKIDSERQVNEARRCVQSIKAKADEEGDTLAETHPLDYESENSRRKFAAVAMGVVGQMKTAKEQVELLETASQSPERGSGMLSQSILNQYNRTIAFKGRMERIEKKVNEAQQCIPLQQSQFNRTPPGRTTYGLTSAPPSSSKKQRPRPIPLTGALSPKPTQTMQTEMRGLGGSSIQQWSEIASALQNLGSEHASTVKVGGLSRLNALLISGSEKKSSSHPRMARSLLLSPAKKAYTTPSKALTSASSSTSITIFSPPSTTKARKGWDLAVSLDQTKAKQMSFALTNDLREVTISDASRKTLSTFGTTPEKVQKSIDLKNSQSATRTPPRPQKHSALSLDSKVASPTKKVPSAAFPPMPTKSPTNPFSQKTDKAKDTDASKPEGGSSYPPLSAVAPKPFSSQSSQASGDLAVQKKVDKFATKAPKPAPAPTSATTAPKTGAFGDMKGLGSSLFSLGDSTATANDTSNRFGETKLPEKTPSQDKKAPDYKSILTSFYQKHNPAKVAEVDKNLEKYKGREVQMFQKLALKYKVPSPLDGTQNATPAPLSTTPVASSSFGSAATAQSPFSSSGGPSTTTTSASPFSSGGAGTTTSSASPFSSGNSGGGMGATSAFGKPPASPFGAPTNAGGMASPSPFGSSSSTSTPFGSGGVSSPSPFGGTSSMTQSSPFGTAAATAPAPAMQAGATQNSFQGRNPREMLTQFYQQKNPTKLGEIDKVLAKYQGKEEQLFRNLAKKYQLDPSVFGISSAPPAAGFGSPAPGPTSFGQASTLGGGASPFGQSTGFGQPSKMGFGAAGGASSGHTFGSGIGGGQGASSFGSLAQAPSPSPFGAPASGGFGAPAPASGGFGAPAPAGGGFGAPAPAFGATSSMGFGGSSPFGAPRR